MSMRVRLYRNLHYRDQRVWSLMAREGPKKGTVIDYVSGAVIRNATFIVNEGGRQRVIRVKEKNVHAFVEGELTQSWPIGENPRHAGADVRVGYNPYKTNTFMREDCDQPVAASPLVIATPDGVYAKLPPCGARGMHGLYDMAVGDRVRFHDARPSDEEGIVLELDAPRRGTRYAIIDWGGRVSTHPVDLLVVTRKSELGSFDDDMLEWNG